MAVIVFNYTIKVYSIEEEKKNINTNKNIKNNLDKKKMFYSILKKLIKIILKPKIKMN